ncbi:MAG: copper homeostasis protein CutC [Bacteroidales bacterium]
MILEVACFSKEASFLADISGADRIEFCLDYAAGGLSPSVSDVEEICRIIQKPVFVMIRPGKGNFLYSPDETEQMLNTIYQMKSAGADGFVFGILDSENEINIKDSVKLIDAASPLPCTFHRAFDQTPDLFRTLERVIDCGFKRILCSGGKGNAIDNIDILGRLCQKASGRIIIMPGGGIRGADIDTLKTTGALEFHSSCITQISDMPDPEEIKLIKENLD